MNAVRLLRRSQFAVQSIADAARSSAKPGTDLRIVFAP